MRISTSTCSYHKTLRAKGPDLTCEDALRAFRRAGFQVIDMNLCGHTRNDGTLTRSDWQDWCHRMRDTADALGLELSQAHAHYFLMPAENVPSEWDTEMLRRSVEAGKILGTRWMVFHPYSCNEGPWYSYARSRQVNLDLFRTYADWCGGSGVHIAIENMIERKDRTRRYCSATEELIDLVDALNDPIFGICWDTGHANMNKVNQCEALRLIGKRLHALHINDNHGENDDHLTPFSGNIDWPPIVQTLREIGYEGDFTYEDFRSHNGLPADERLRDSLLRYSYEVAEYLLSLGAEA